MGYDTIIQHIGSFGKYQRRVFSVLILPAIGCAFHEMGGVFLTAKADFRCLLPHENPENATYQLPPNITNITHPWDEVTETWSQCERYDPDIVESHHATGENITSTIPTVKCQSFVYDKTYYTQTATFEWNLVCDSAWLESLSQSLFVLGSIPGMIFGGLSDRYGRRKALLWSAIMNMIFGLLLIISPNFNAYMVFRTLIGGTTGIQFLIAYVAVLEMVGPQFRSTAGVTMYLIYAAGYMSSAVLAYFIRTWRYLQLAFTVPSIAVVAFYWSTSESPRWLLSKGRVQEARDIIQNIASVNGIKLSPHKLDGWLTNGTESKPAIEKPSVYDLLRYPDLRKKSLLLFFIWVVIFIAYYGLSWSTSNLGGNDYVSYVIAAAVEIPAYLSQLYTSERWGRRMTLCGSMMLAGTSLLVTFFIPTRSTWLVILFAMIGKFAISLSFGSANIFTVEQYPTAYRNIALATLSGFAKIGGALAPFINNLSQISTFLPLVVFGSSSIIAGLSSLLLPETLNEKLPETIQDAEQLGKNTSTAKQDFGQFHDNAGFSLEVQDGIVATGKPTI